MQGVEKMTPKIKEQPHAKQYPYHLTPRCGAKTRTGNPCQSPAVCGKKRCRMHGGSKGSGAPVGNRNSLKHGFYSLDAVNFRNTVRDLVK